MQESFEINLTKEEKNLFCLANKQKPKRERWLVKKPKLSIDNLSGNKKIMLMPNEGWWGIVIFRTTRKKPITEKEARRKLCKWLNIILYWDKL